MMIHWRVLGPKMSRSRSVKASGCLKTYSRSAVVQRERGLLDHAPRGLQSGDQFVGGMHCLALFLFLPVHVGGYLGISLAHPQIEPPDPVIEDVLDEHPNRPVCGRDRQG